MGFIILANGEKNLKEISIFIACPDDLISERNKFYEIVERVNKVKAKPDGIFLESRSWKETLPGPGRPQEKINEDLRKCDLVVMLLWKKWGSDTGAYSSGFEEEYNEAHRLKKYILLYFREIPELLLEDPGEQLKKVLEFRSDVEDKKNCLFYNYKDENEWGNKFFDNLCEWLDKKRSGSIESDTYNNSLNNIIYETDFKSIPEISDEIINEMPLKNFYNYIIIDNHKVPYFKFETEVSLGCTLFCDFFWYPNRTYFFHSHDITLSVKELEIILEEYFKTFGSDSKLHNPTFTINQVCWDKETSFSWFGYGPENFIQALNEQNIRYSEARIVRPHHNEIAGFVAQRFNHIFYIAFQPRVVEESKYITLDHVQVGFVFEAIPFNNNKFIEFYRKANLEMPQFIYQEEEVKSKREYLDKVKLENEGFVLYDEDWVSKIVCNNPFYKNNDINKILSQNEKLVVNLRDYHPFNFSKKYTIEQFTIIPMPYDDFILLNVRGNW